MLSIYTYNRNHPYLGFISSYRSKCNQNCFISINKILYIESYQRKRIIYTKEQVYETGASLNDLLSLLPVEQFEMPQKSYIVNFDHITSITKTKVILDYSTEIKLARDRMTNFNMKFQKYIRG